MIRAVRKAKLAEGGEGAEGIGGREEGSQAWAYVG